LAYDLHRINNEECLAFPAIYKGKLMAQWPEEGRGGLLYLIYIKGKKRWVATYVSCGWIYTEELKLSNKEIWNNIVEDVVDGKNVWTRPLPGWE
jgi:hypothetical protein